MAIVLLKPNYPPYVCIVCGLGTRKDRKWFVDLQLAIDNYFNPVNDGAIYLCNECWDGLVRSVGHQAYTVMKEEEPWEASLEITYNSEDQLLTVSPLSSASANDAQLALEDSSPPVGLNTSPESLDDNAGTGISGESPGELNFTITGDDTNTETTDSEPDTDTTDDESNPVREFREFFGKSV